MSRSLIACLALLALVCASASADELTAVENAAVFSRYPDLNDPGTNDSKWCNFSRYGDSEIGGMMLFKFDLTSYAGKLVDGDAVLQAYCFWHWTIPNAYGSFAIISNWNESTVTWGNFVGATTGDAYNAVVGDMMGDINLDAAGLWQWTVSNDVIQGWIDNAADNNGVAVRPLATSANDCWRTRQWVNGAQVPKLIFTLQNLNKPPRMPTNMTPTDATIGLARPVTLTASAFSDEDGDGHKSSQWQVSLDEAFTAAGLSKGWNSGTTASDLTNVTVPASALVDNERYWWRVRYEDDNPDGSKWSEWSTPTRFDTELNILGSITRDAVEFAMIDPSEPDKVSNQANTNSFVLGPQITNVCPAGFIMVKFDLAALSEYTSLLVDSEGLLEAITLWVNPSWPATFQVHPLMFPWQQSNVTWNSYIGGDWSSWSNTVGAELDFQVFDTSGMTGQWPSIDEYVMQTWLSHPASNFGLALVPESNGNIGWRVSPVPTLTFDLVNTNASIPDQPVNIAPVDGADNQSRTPTLQSSAFSGGASAHKASQWQISSEASFGNIVWDSGADTGALIQISVPSNTLNNSSRYHWRVRHINQEGGLSPWSDPTYFDTVVIFGLYTKLSAMDACIRYAHQASNENSVTRSFYHPLGSSNGINPLVMVWFDLGVFEGLDAVGDAQLKVEYGFVDVNFGDQGLTCYRLLRPWQESTVTWESYFGPGETNLALGLGESFGQQLAIENESSVWTVAQATIQDWFDNADTNFGLGLYVTTGSGNLFLQSGQTAARAPRLTLEVIPEPAAALAVLALAGAAVMRARRARS